MTLRLTSNQYGRLF